MKTRLIPAGNRNGSRGSATVIVLALLFLMVAFIAGNSANLRSLELELRRVERIQLRKYQPRPGASALPARAALDRSPAK